MKIGLTPKQRELLDYIEAYSQESGASPSYQQMMERLGLHSKSGVHRLACQPCAVDNGTGKLGLAHLSDSRPR
jgi:hypothetical protein